MQHIYKQKVIENTCTLTYTDTKVIKNAKLIKAYVGLKLFVVLGLMKLRSTFSLTFSRFFFFDLNHTTMRKLSN